MNIVDLFEENDCIVELNESTRKAIFENSLLSQLIALHLNFQVNPESAALDLNEMCFDIDPKLMDELGNNTTVGALFELAEKALSGFYSGNVYRLERTIVETLEYFTECPVHPCQDELNVEGYSDRIPTGFATLEIYPNPAIDQLNIVVRDVQEELVLKVYSSLGDLVYEKAINSSIYDQINIDHLPSGMYQTVLLNKNRVLQNEKFIKVNE